MFSIFTDTVLKQHVNFPSHKIINKYIWAQKTHAYKLTGEENFKVKDVNLFRSAEKT